MASCPVCGRAIGEKESNCNGCGAAQSLRRLPQRVTCTNETLYAELEAFAAGELAAEDLSDETLDLLQSLGVSLEVCDAA